MKQIFFFSQLPLNANCSISSCCWKLYQSADNIRMIKSFCHLIYISAQGGLGHSKVKALSSRHLVCASGVKIENGQNLRNKKRMRFVFKTGNGAIIELCKLCIYEIKTLSSRGRASAETVRRMRGLIMSIRHNTRFWVRRYVPTKEA